MLNSLVL